MPSPANAQLSARADELTAELTQYIPYARFKPHLRMEIHRRLIDLEITEEYAHAALDRFFTPTRH